MHGVGNHEPVHVKHGKCIFCTTRRVFAHAHNKLEFDDAEMLSGRSNVNRTQKFSYYSHIYLKDEKKKLRWQWNSVYIKWQILGDISQIHHRLTR